VALAVGELPASFDWMHPAWGLLAGLIILYFILKFYGKNPEAEIAEA
jgi:hypothetical protein